MNKFVILNEELGQVLTPPDISDYMVDKSLKYFDTNLKILDPACGPATFVNSLQKKHTDFEITQYDIDPQMVSLAKEYCQNCQLKNTTLNEDYLLSPIKYNYYDLVLMNPPYIRQEKIPLDLKKKYNNVLSQEIKVNIDSRSNLFIYFLIKSYLELKDNGIMCAILFNSISKTNYGVKCLNFLKSKCKILFSENLQTPFKDTIIDAEILIFKKITPPPTKENQPIEITKNYVTLNELLFLKRGSAIPNRKAYIFKDNNANYKDYLIPIFIKQQYISGLVVNNWNYVYNPYNETTEWFIDHLHKNKLEFKKFNLVSGMLLFNYYIRNNPRFLWNGNKVAVSDNFYASETRDDFPNEVAWLLLNSDIYTNAIVAASRDMGNGLKKIQLQAYKSVCVPDWRLLSKEKINFLYKLAISLIDENASVEKVKNKINNLLEEIFNDTFSSKTNRL